MTNALKAKLKEARAIGEEVKKAMEAGQVSGGLMAAEPDGANDAQGFMAYAPESLKPGSQGTI